MRLLANDFFFFKKQTKSYYSPGALSFKAMALKECMTIQCMWQFLKTFFNWTCL